MSTFAYLSTYSCLFLSFSPAFPPLTNIIIPFFHPFSLLRRNGSRRSGRSLNTPACGSRRVCPSVASTLADDSSSRSFERRLASLFLPLSFSFFLLFFLSCFFFSLFLSLSFSVPPFPLSFSLTLSLFLGPYILLSSDSLRSSRTTDVRLAIECRSIYLPSGYDTAPVRPTHRIAAAASSLAVPFAFFPNRKRSSGMAFRQTRESWPRTD